ncbi:NAD-P-binding protein [Mycena alexandri]|uniref:NAD-P-binding protein n=1 Tax=Mycena alexandri TaxID=1745969 RepID=A0AAD6STM1_9AGAR|nr:NAD-P-binding protein [Mycena alexandri]
MRLLLFGGTGAMGALLAREFLWVYQGSSTLVLYVRNAAKVPEDLAQDRSVVVIQGELDDMDALSKAMHGVNAVITALGPTGRKGPFYPGGTPVAAAYIRIMVAMKGQGVRRLIALTTPSVRAPEDQFSLPLVFLRKAFAAVSPNAVKDIVAIGRVVRAQRAELDWTLIRLAVQTSDDEEDPANCQVIAGYMGDGRTNSVSSRVGAAVFIIEELEKREWIWKCPILSTPTRDCNS